MLHDLAVTAAKILGGVTAGQLLVAQGPGLAPIWRTPSGAVTVDANGVFTVSSGTVDPSDLATIGKAATNLAQDDLVYVSSVTGAGVPVFSPADADVVGAQASWVCTATLAAGSTSSTAIFRKAALSVATLNTNAGNVGDPVYLTATGTTGNTWSLSAPAAGVPVQAPGRICVKSATVGQIAWDISSLGALQSVGTAGLAAQSVTPAKLSRGTDGQLLVGATGADPAYQSPSGAFTLSNTGVATLQPVVAPNKVAAISATPIAPGAIPAGSGAVPYELVLGCTNVASSDLSFTGCPFKFQVTGVRVQKTNGAGTVTYTVKNGAAAITDAIATVNDNELKYAAQIDDANSLIAAGGTITVTIAKTSGDTRALVILDGFIAA